MRKHIITIVQSSLPLLALLIIIISSPVAVDGTKGRCNADDRRALFKIKSAFNNAYHFASWVPSDPCCDYYDVECDPSAGRVVGLRIFQDPNITGTIPAAIADLPYLQNLILHHLPGVYGPIPPAIARLSRLRLLIISYTSVSGAVPSFLSSLTALIELDLSFNRLTGAIPESLSELPNLFSIDLSRNNLTGSLPPGLFKQATQAQYYLVLSHNNISGAIPAEYAAVQFEQVDLSRNQLTGEASALFGAARTMELLDLSRNKLEFNLTDVEFPTRLTNLDLSHNVIGGSIPEQIANLTNLQFFNVSYNRLCGAIPSAANLAQFDVYSFFHNKCLCGAPLPPCK